jgi:hypothetical protein
MIDAFEVATDGVTVAPGVCAGAQVFFNSQVLENAASFHHLNDPTAHECSRFRPIDPCAEELNAALGDLAALDMQEIRDGLQRRAFASAIGPEKSHNTPLGNDQRHPLQNQNNMVINHLNVVHREEGGRHSAHFFSFSLA